MPVEWVIFLLLWAMAAALALPILKRYPCRWSLVIGALAVLSLGAAAARHRHFVVRAATSAAFNRSLPQEGRPGGYVSSDQCRACHPSEYGSWHRSYHRTMTQYGSKTTFLGAVDQTLNWNGDTIQLRERAGQIWAEMPDLEWKERQAARARALGEPLALPPAPRVEKAIGLLTGSHHMQVGWVPSSTGNMQLIFPFMWLIEDQRWVPFSSTFLRDPNLPPQTHIWNLNCINCHATAGQPRFEPSTQRMDSRAGQLGIACEACHGPGEEHAELNMSPPRRYGLRRAGAADPSIVNPKRLDPQLSAHVCGQCHGIKWIPAKENWAGEGFSYRPGAVLDESTPIVRPSRLAEQSWLQEPLRRDTRFISDRYWADGMVRVSGREYNGLVDSPCFQKGALTCLSCHSMHQSDPDDQLAAGKRGAAACTQCHTRFREDVAAHTHHRAESAGSDCYNCHMPHTTYGLLKAIRSHEISSPLLRRDQSAGRPNACNLCHLDQTLAWTARYLQEWYGQLPPPIELEEEQTSAALLWLLKGDAGQRALAAWHMGWRPAQLASEADWLPPFVAQSLADPYSAIRYIAHRSLRSLPSHRNFSFDFLADAGELNRQAEAVVREWESGPSARPRPDYAKLLLNPEGTVNHGAVDDLKRRRDNRSVDLQE